MLTSVRPPNPPWKEIQLRPDQGAYLSFYHSDDLSHLPVRAVTKLKDNKSDPNLETQTYGLFSTCWSTMRSGVVARGTPYVFFVTRRGMAKLGNDERVVTGYYRVKWYADNVSIVNGDVALAADKCHFVENPIPLKRVASAIGHRLNPRSRSPSLLSKEDSKSLRELLDHQVDATPIYLKEVDRLERFNLAHGGARYVSWRQEDPFTWGSAVEYLLRPPAGNRRSPARSNKSPTDWWVCIVCHGYSESVSLLRKCPLCSELATLKPATVAELRARRKTEGQASADPTLHFTAGRSQT